MFQNALSILPWSLSSAYLECSTIDPERLSIKGFLIIFLARPADSECPTTDTWRDPDHRCSDPYPRLATPKLVSRG